MSELYFDGDDYDHERDQERLLRQIDVIFRFMIVSDWVTLEEIAEVTNYSTASISAQLRNLRKERFGSHTLEKKRMPQGHYLYKLIPNQITIEKFPFSPKPLRAS